MNQSFFKNIKVPSDKNEINIDFDIFSMKMIRIFCQHNVFLKLKWSEKNETVFYKNHCVCTLI